MVEVVGRQEVPEGLGIVSSMLVQHASMPTEFVPYEVINAATFEID